MNFLDGSLFPENQDKLVITVAPYGPEWMPSDFPEDIAVTIDEQVQKAVDCYNAGATVLHVHVRELDGKGSKRLSKFNELLGRLRVAVPDMVLQVGGSISFAPETEGAAAKWLSDDTRHMLAELDPKPDQVTVTVNTSQMNVVEQMCEADLAGTTLAEPANYNAYREMTVPGGPGWVEEHVRRLNAARHPERVPVLQHQHLRDRRAHDPPRRLQGPLVMNWVASAAAWTRPTSTTWPTSCAPCPMARCSRSEQHAQHAADQHDGHRHGAARALRHRGQPLDSGPQGQDEHGEADRAAGAHLARVRPRDGDRQRGAPDLQDRRVLQKRRRDAREQRLRAEPQAGGGALRCARWPDGTRRWRKRFAFTQTGGPEVLQLEEVAVGHPGPGQARLRHVAVGLNFADTYFRTGLYPMPLPTAWASRRPESSRRSVKA